MSVVHSEWPQTDRSIHSFEKWNDGGIHECFPEVDFQCAPRLFRSRALNWGRTRGLRVTTKIVRDTQEEGRPVKSVFIQFLNPKKNKRKT